MPLISVRLFEQISQNSNPINFLDLLPTLTNILTLVGAVFGGLYLYKRHQRHQLIINAKYEAFKSFFAKHQRVSKQFGEALVEFNFIRNDWSPSQELLRLKKDFFIKDELPQFFKDFSEYYAEFELWECFLAPLEKAKLELFKKKL